MVGGWVVSFVAISFGGGVVVVAVDVTLVGNTCLVAIFAFVSTNVFAGIPCLPDSIAAAFVFSVFGSCGPAPV